MTKKQIRQQMISKMKTFAKSECKEKIDHSLLQKLLNSSLYQNSKIIATYISMPNEFNTGPLIRQALKDGKTILVPKTYPKGQMIFVQYNPEELQTTSFGLLEPISDLEVSKSLIDCIHVPGVVFNADGHRIGYGAGYYDRYLADYVGQTVSTIYVFQLQEFTNDPYDIPVRKIIQ